MIHVCYGLYDRDGRYSKFTGTSMLSMFENISTPPPSVIVHILHDNTLTADNRDKFVYIAGRYGQVVKFYNVEKLCANKITEFRKRWTTIDENPATIGTMFRLLIPETIPIDINKIIYLDSDVIVNLDINELWKIDISDKPVAAVPEAEMGNAVHISKTVPLCSSGIVKVEDYFNAGVLLMNLDILRNENDFIDRAMVFFSKYPPLLWDQDILNVAFSARYLKLPMKYNRFIHLYRNEGVDHMERRIYHYGGDHLRMDLKDNLNRWWMEYFAKTPWFNENSIGNLYEGFKQIYIAQKDFAAKISAVMSGKTRAFLLSPNMLEAAKRIFYISANEEIIIANSQESLQQMANSIMASNRSKVFFLLTGEYKAINAILTRAGFVENVDFINGMEFLSDVNGVPLNSHSLVKLL